MNWVPFEWTLRDIAQGWRGVAVLLVALVPTLFILLIHLTVETIPDDEKALVASNTITIFIVPLVVGLLAILAAGSVMRSSLEDGTLIYQVTRPMNRGWVGIQRALAATLVVTVAAGLSGLSLVVVLGFRSEVLHALPGLLLAGFAFGALYGLLQSLHRYAVGLSLIHLVLDWAFVSVPIEAVNRLTISWHAMGAMGDTMEVAVEEGIHGATGGNPAVPLVIGLASVGLTALLFRVKRMHLGLPEA